MEGSPDLVIVATSDGRIRYVGPAVERTLGYSSKEFMDLAPDLAKLIDRFVHPDDRELVTGELAEATSGSAHSRPAVITLRARHKDGSWRHLEAYINDLPGDPAMGGVVFVGRNVTERVRAEEEARGLRARVEEMLKERTTLRATIARLEGNERALRVSEEKFRLAFDRAAVGIALVGPGGGWISVNDKLCDIVGYSREELLERTFQDITHPDDLEKDLRHVGRMFAGKISEYSIEKRYIRKDRSYVWIELTVSLIKNPEGKPDYFISIIEDISGRKLKDLIPEPLTPREMEVLRRIIAQQTNLQIAEALAYSVGTIKLCVRSIIAKLGVRDRRQAASRAVEIGLFPP